MWSFLHKIAAVNVTRELDYYEVCVHVGRVQYVTRGKE